MSESVILALSDYLSWRLVNLFLGLFFLWSIWIRRGAKWLLVFVTSFTAFLCCLLDRFVNFAPLGYLALFSRFWLAIFFVWFSFVRCHIFLGQKSESILLLSIKIYFLGLLRSTRTHVWLLCPTWAYLWRLRVRSTWFFKLFAIFASHLEFCFSPIFELSIFILCSSGDSRR